MTWEAGFPEKYAFLDEEHAALARALRDLQESTGLGEDPSPRLKALQFTKLLKEHTKNEEDLMESLGYPDRSLHEVHHEILLDSVQCIIDLFDNSSITAFRESIVTHIENRLSEEMLVDSQFAAFLRAREDGA